MYQVLTKTIRVFKEFEEVTSGMNGLCIEHAHKWHIRNRFVFLMTMTSRLQGRLQDTIFQEGVHHLEMA